MQKIDNTKTDCPPVVSVCCNKYSLAESGDINAPRYWMLYPIVYANHSGGFASIVVTPEPETVWPVDAIDITIYPSI